MTLGVVAVCSHSRVLLRGVEAANCVSDCVKRNTQKISDWLYASWINILLILGLNANCKRCHGVEGLGYLPGDLTGAEIQTILLVTPGEYLCRVAEGLDGMPSFKRKMTEDEIWQVFTFTSTLGQ